MLTILSPAKKLDFESESLREAGTTPEFAGAAAEIAGIAGALTLDQIQGMMKLSEKLAVLTHGRFADFKADGEGSRGRQAVFAFRGDAYLGLDADTLSDADIDYAQDHLRILSGMYGALRPRDMIQAYRLEMATKLRNPRGRDLYAYWKDDLVGAVNEAVNRSLGGAAKGGGEPILVNLASKEYFSAIDAGSLKARVVTAHFKEIKDGVPKIMSFFAKKARGMMTRFIIQNRIEDPEGLKDFAAAGYVFNPALSAGDDMVFTRDYPPSP
ncbi:MAG: peroxide stress protein YaaA [Proteobacteria bacterium]|nr:peroxide stress protein YaaA [Pseudomonadota bacterium]